MLIIKIDRKTNQVEAKGALNPLATKALADLILDWAMAEGQLSKRKEGASGIS